MNCNKFPDCHVLHGLPVLTVQVTVGVIVLCKSTSLKLGKFGKDVDFLHFETAKSVKLYLIQRFFSQ